MILIITFNKGLSKVYLWDYFVKRFTYFISSTCEIFSQLVLASQNSNIFFSSIPNSFTFGCKGEM